MSASFQEPFGLALKGRIVDGLFDPSYVKLPEGVNTIMVTGAEDRALRLSIFSGYFWSTRIRGWDIPAGTKTATFTVGVLPGETRTISLGVTTGIAEETFRATIMIITTPLQGSGGGGVVSAAFWGLLGTWLRGGRNDHTGHVRHNVGDYAPRSHGVSIPTGAENTGLNRHSGLDPCGNPAPFRYDYGDDRLVGIVRPANSSEERRHQLPHEECGISYLRHPENAVAASTHRIHRAYPRYHRHQPHPGGPGQSPLRSSDNSRVLAFSGGAA